MRDGVAHDAHRAARHVEPRDRHDLDVEAEPLREPEQLDVEGVALRRLQVREQQRGSAAEPLEAALGVGEAHAADARAPRG